MRILLIISFILLVCLGAVSDVLNDTGMITIGHALGALEIGGLLCVPVLFKININKLIAFVAAYVCFRIVGFDYMYNWVAGNELTYHGQCLWDSFLSKFHHHGILFARVIFLITGIAVVFKEL